MRERDSEERQKGEVKVREMYMCLYLCIQVGRLIMNQSQFKSSFMATP